MLVASKRQVYPLVDSLFVLTMSDVCSNVLLEPQSASISDTTSFAKAMFRPDDTT